MYNELKKDPTACDIVCPSEDMILKMKDEGLIKQFNMPENYAQNASPYIKSVFEDLGLSDGERTYAVGYMWGTMGLIYNMDKYNAEDLNSWSKLYDQKFSGKITIKDSIRDSYIMSLGIVYKDELLSLKDKLNSGEILEAEYKEKSEELNRIKELVIKVNASGFLPDETKEELEKYFKLSYVNGEETIPYFTEEEKEDLLIKKGTLTERERLIMESHVEVTERILNKVHFQANYMEAPRFAVEHHECLNGMGYPKKLTKDVLCLESRILAVADICDALLATDRPYKKPLPKEKAFEIMYDMADAGRIDKKIVEYMEACL